MARAPVPYPFDFSAAVATVLIPKTSMLTAPGVTAITGDAAWTYAADDPTTYPAPGWFSGTPSANVAVVDSFVFGSHSPVNQHYERTFTPGSFPGLAPNKMVRLNGIIDWYRYTAASNFNARVFCKVNGIGLTNIPGTLTGAGSGPSAFSIVAACDGSGNLTIEFGIYLDDGIGSISIGATLLEMEVLSIVANPWDIIADSAVMFHNGTTPISISRDSFKFERRAVYEEYDYPGKVAPTYLGDELLSESPALIGNFMNVGEAPFLVYDPGSTWASGSYDRTLTPFAFRTVHPAGAYLSDVRCVWRLLSGEFLQVRFPKAFCRSYDIGSVDKDEGKLPVIIEARQDYSGTVSPKAVPLYYIDRMPSTWAPVP